MAKIFEYIINVPTKDLDAAKVKLEQLKNTGTDAAKSVGQAFKDTGAAVKQNIKDYGVLGAAGKGAITGLAKGFKGFGTVIKGVGTALKANPIFTLASIILPIVEAIKDFIMNLGFVQKIMEVVGDAIQYVIDLLKKFSDWLGLTSFAEEEAAEKAHQAAKDRIAINEQLYQGMFADMENEIRLLQAQGANIEEIEEKQLELARVKAAVAQQTLEDNAKVIEQEILLAEKAGESTIELQKQLLQLQQNAKQAGADLEILEATISTAREKRAAAAQAELDKQAEADKNARKAAAKARADENKRRLAEEAAFAAEREKVRRQIEDLSIAAIEDQTTRELEQNRIKYERLIADTLANEKLLKEEKDALIASFEAEQQTKDEAIKKAKQDKDIADELAKEQAKQDAIDEFNALIKSQRDLDEFEQRQEKAEEDLEAELAILRNLLENKAITQEEFDRLELEAAQKQADALLEIEMDRLKKESEERIAQVSKNIQTAVQYANAVNSLNQSISTISNNLGKQDEKSKLERAKRQFKRDKALNIITAGINGALSITQAIAQFGPPPSPLGIAAIASSGIVTLANIAAIASTKFDGGESGAAATPNLSTAATEAPVPSTPTFNMFGTGAGDIQGGASTEVTGNGQQTIRAVVSETDLVETTQRLDAIRNTSEL